MTWNYRIVKHEEPDPDKTWFGLHEAFYGTDCDPSISTTLDPTSFVGDTQKEVVDALTRALNDALTRPILVDKNGTITETTIGPGDTVE